MKEHLKKLLLALGFTQAQIDDLDKDAPEGKQEEFIASVVENQKKLLKNDADFMGEIQKAEKGRVLSSVDSLIKKTFGLTPEEVKDAKTTAELVALGHTKAISKSGSTTEELQKQNVELAAKIKALEEDEIPKIRAEVDMKKKKIDIDFKAAKVLDDFKFIVDPAYAKKNFLYELESEFDVEENDKGELIPKSKATGLQAKSADGTKLLTLKDIASEKFEKAKILQKSNADPGGTAKPIYQGKSEEGEAKEKFVTNSSLSKAEQNLKNMPKVAEAKQ